jgi:hypothetical protein
MALRRVCPLRRVCWRRHLTGGLIVPSPPLLHDHLLRSWCLQQAEHTFVSPDMHSGTEAGVHISQGTQ